MAPSLKEEGSGKANSDSLALLTARIADSSLAQTTSTVHVLPSTSNPAAFGLFGLAVCNALHMGPFLGLTDNGADHLMYSFALFFGGLGQLVAGWLEFQRKNTWACVTWLSYSGYWLGYGISGILDVSGTVPTSPEGWQMANCLWGVLTFILWINTFCLNGAVCFMMFMLTIQFFLEAGASTNYGGAMWKATGVFGFIVSFMAFYIACAVLMLEMYQKDILPLFPLDWQSIRGRRKYGVTGTRRDLAPQVEGEEELHV